MKNLFVLIGFTTTCVIGAGITAYVVENRRQLRLRYADVLVKVANKLVHEARRVLANAEQSS